MKIKKSVKKLKLIDKMFGSAQGKPFERNHVDRVI